MRKLFEEGRISMGKILPPEWRGKYVRITVLEMSGKEAVLKLELVE